MSVNKSKRIKTKLFSSKDSKSKRVFNKNKSSDRKTKKAVKEVSLNLSKDRKFTLSYELGSSSKNKLKKRDLIDMVQNLSKDIHKDYQKYLINRPLERRSELPKSNKLMKSTDSGKSYFKESINLKVEPFNRVRILF